jgi:hypothetical protein
MTKGKRAKSRGERVSFTFGGKGGFQKISYNRSLISTLKVLTFVFALAAAAFGLLRLKKYVESLSEKTVVVELMDVPGWASESLKKKVFAAAKIAGPAVNENTAALVQQNISKQVAWLDDVKVQTTHNSIRISCRWRKPIAWVQSGLHNFYIDADMVVLDYVQMPNLPVVEIKGLLPAVASSAKAGSVTAKIPPPGQVWLCDDLAAAIAILARLDRMDRIVTPNKPLLNEIAYIDMTNFNGRKNHKAPHIILYTTDNTEIIWGAEIGTWQRYVETPDEEKLAKLYGHYKEFGSLLKTAKYINLRDPQDRIPQPIDRY